MSPWLIAGLCLAASGIVAWGSARLDLRWPLLALCMLLAIISVQLLVAARGREGFHDLAALVAQAFTVLPALIGIALGLAAAHVRRHRLAWRGRGGIATMLALLIAAAALAATFLI